MKSTPIIKSVEEKLRLAFQKKAQAALGSDAGAYMVPHGRGILEEYESFCRILGEDPSVDSWLRQGEKAIRDRFRHLQS